MSAVNVESIPEAGIWAPYRDAFHAAEMADTFAMALVRIQWRGRDEQGRTCCPHCFAPAKGRTHYATCPMTQAVEVANAKV